MKTLDEVIDELEDEGLFPDALHYLKEYRSDKSQWKEDKKAYEDEWQKAIHATKKARERYIALAKDTKDELGVLRDFRAEQQANPPLTWQELKQMEGKPVWIERAEWKEWLLISEIDKDKCEIYLRDMWGNGVSVNARNVGYWRAYRKERNEDAG